MRLEASQLRALGLEGEARGGEFVALCPFHDDTQPSLGVRLRDGVWNCLGCGRHGSWATLRRELGAPPDPLEDELAPEPDPEPVSWQRRLREKSRAGGLTIRVLQENTLEQFPCVEWETVVWLAERRRISPEVALTYDVRTGKGRLAGYAVIPIRDRRGRLISFTARHMSSNDPREKVRKATNTDARKVLFGEDVLERFWSKTKEVALVEGEIDAMSGMQCGFPTLALMGWVPTQSQLRKIRSRFLRVTLCLDSTVAAEDVDRVARMLRPYVQVRTACTREKDLNAELCEHGVTGVRHALA